MMKAMIIGLVAVTLLVHGTGVAGEGHKLAGCSMTLVGGMLVGYLISLASEADEPYRS